MRKLITPIVCQLCKMDWQTGACGDCSMTRKQLDACSDQQRELGRLTELLAEKDQQLLEENLQVKRLESQLTTAHRQGWEQGKFEALTKSTGRSYDAIACMEYEMEANDESV